MTANEPRRRDIIHLVTIGTAIAGVGALGWAIGKGSGGPAGARIEPSLIDISDLAEGQQIKILVGTSPVFIRHRTAAEISAAQAVDISDLYDPQTDAERLRPQVDGRFDPSILVLIGACTHAGCVPVEEAGDFEGWFCPCHSSHFDTSGRVRKGPAAFNMKIPNYSWVDETTLSFPHPMRPFSDADADALRCPDTNHA